jgi:AraC-like DNA-binding protein
MKEIAVQLSQLYFSRRFRAFSGMSPREFRKKRRGAG